MTQKLIYVRGEGSSRPKYVFVGEAPGAEEEKSGYPFEGRSGRFLRSCLGELGITQDKCYFTNVVKIRPENNRPPTKDEINSWIPILKEELELLHFIEHIIERSEVLYIALGKTAEKALNSIYFCQSNLYSVEHPSYVLRFNKKDEWIEKLKGVIHE